LAIQVWNSLSWAWEKGPYRDLDAYKAQLETSLEVLKRDCVDVFFVQEADWAVYWEDMEIPRSRCEVELSDTFDYESAPVTQFLVWAQEQEMIKHIGISGNNSHLLTKILRAARFGRSIARRTASKDRRFGKSISWAVGKRFLM
jgi:aryl-alcohol dehydrogenase-like predicted oxidoreductase